MTDLVLRQIAGSGRGRARYELVDPYEVSMWFGDIDSLDGISISVPAGFVTDFASVPRCLHWLYPPDGPWCRAAVVHDHLYREGRCSRFLADAIFRHLMASHGVPWWRASILYYAVRLFGRRAFRADTEE